MSGRLFNSDHLCLKNLCCLCLNGISCRFAPAVPAGPVLHLLMLLLLLNMSTSGCLGSSYPRVLISMCRRSARLAAAVTDTVTPATASPAPLGQQDPNQQLQPPRLRQQQQQHHPVQAFSSTLGSENAPAGDGAAAAAAGMHALGHHVQQPQAPEAKAQQQQQQDQVRGD